MRATHNISVMPAAGDATNAGSSGAAASAKAGKLAVAAQRQVHPRGRKRARPPNHALGSPQLPGGEIVLLLCWAIQP